jgi:2'-5' RNA ligase
MRQPRVLWVGIRGEVDKLVAWQQRIDNGLIPLGFAKETRAFTPHLTLARLREGCSPEDRRDFGEMVAKTPIEVSYKFNITSLNLMKSQLLPGGAVYNRLAEVKLKG